MSLKIRPLGGRLLLQIFEEQDKVVGGIIVKAQARRDGFRNAIVRALPDNYRGDLCVGDAVLMPPYGGVEHIINKERLVFIKESELPAAVVNG